MLVNTKKYLDINISTRYHNSDIKGLKDCPSYGNESPV